jgi:hypothetical protein
MALGAERAAVVRLVLSQSLSLVVAGIAAGAALAVVLSRLLRALLFEVRPGDPRLVIAQAGKAVAVPDTPQGKHVDAYIKAFNSGDEKQFLAAHELHMSKSILDKRPAAERGQMFKRMQGDFDTLEVQRLVKSTPQQIQIIVPTKAGDEATFTFDFEKDAPYRISAIGVDIKDVERE